MSERVKKVQYFLFSQYLADGIRTTLEIILPTIIFSQLGDTPTGMTMSLGALCVSISDAPGPVLHKRNGMLWTNIFIFVMAILTGLVNHHIILMGSLVTLSAFIFTMFALFGTRAAAVGTAALLLMILQMDKVQPLSSVWTDSLLLLAGGTWYMLVALLFFRLTPYRPAQRSLGDCIHETAKFLLIKSELYDPSNNLEDEYRKLVSQQVIVNEKQDALRELLYKNRELVKEPSRSAKRLVLTFAEVMDLYEHIMATWYDYSSIRERFTGTGILEGISSIIKRLATELDHIGVAIQANTSYRKHVNLIPQLDALKAKMEGLTDKGNIMVLKKILVNLLNHVERIDSIAAYFHGDTPSRRKMHADTDYSKFVSHQEINTSVLKNNLSLESSIFRHALRMAITCLLGFAIAKLLSYGHHSYWILLTIIIILKPGFSLTRQRNIERITGTIAGGLLGVLILYFIPDKNILFTLLVFFMIGTYTYQRLNYIVMVIFTTPYILIVFSFLGLGFIRIAEERLLDTGIASVLAFLASYLLFPHWESTQLNTSLAGVLKANIRYLQQLASFFSGKRLSPLEYKLIRKDLYVSTANLSAAFHRMLSEPKSKQLNSNLIYEFVVLNHVLSSNIAAFTTGIDFHSDQPFSRELMLTTKRSINRLEESLKLFDPGYAEESAGLPLTAVNTPPDKELKEQLDFIYKISSEITKVTREVVNKK